MFAAVTICLSSVTLYRPAVSAVDVYQFSENGFYYTISAVSGTIEACVVGYKPASEGGTVGSITIPAALGTYAVTSIGTDAFADQSTLTAVSIPQSVRSIGTGAFQNCSALTNVTIAAGLTNIAEGSFKGCSSLTTLNLPATVTSIGSGAFEDCASLKTMTLPASLTSIGSYAFRRCKGIETLVLPNTVTAVGEGAFEECTALKTLTLSTGMTRIEDFTFYKCSLLTPLNLTENINSIGRYAFSECTSLSSVTFPKSVVSIGSSAFENCQYLAVAIIPNTTQYIAPTAFRNDPVSVYGYSGTPAETFCRENNIPFTSYGSVYKVTFSADIYNASVDNISIKTPSGTIVPPATVQNDEELTISATAPDGYVVDHITVNDMAFTSGSVYRVHNADVNIFVSYRLRDATTTTTTAITTVTTPETTTTTTTARVTTVTTTTTRNTTTTTTTATTTAPETSGSAADTTVPPDTADDQYVTVDSTLEGVGGNNVRIVTKRSNFIGPAIVKLSNTPEASEAAEVAASTIVGDGTMYYYGFDITLCDETGRPNSGIMSGGSITFMVPVPDILAPYMDDISVYHIEDGGKPVLIPSGIIEDVNGVKRVQFEADSFSPYMFVTGSDEVVHIEEETSATEPEEDGEITVISEDEELSGEQTTTTTATNRPTAGNTSTGSNNNTGIGRLNPGTGALLLIGIPSVTLGCVLLAKKGSKEKRTRTKKEVK